MQSGRDHQTAALFASHNVDSARYVLEQLRDLKLVKNRGRGLDVLEELRGRIVFGQLLGMSDSLTVVRVCALPITFICVVARRAGIGATLRIAKKPARSCTSGLDYALQLVDQAAIAARRGRAAAIDADGAQVPALCVHGPAALLTGQMALCV